MMKTEEYIKNIVAFCALMQNGEGIIGKSPAYIEEKFTRFCQSEVPEYKWGLDSERQKLLNDWIERWLKPKSEAKTGT